MPRGKGAAKRGAKANLRSRAASPPTAKKTKGDAPPEEAARSQEESDEAIAAQAADRALFAAWKVAQSTSLAAAAAKASSPTAGPSSSGTGSLSYAGHLGSSSGSSSTAGLDLATVSNGHGAGNEQPREEWQKGTSNTRGIDWDFALPHSMETPEHLAIICPPAHKKLIQEGVYINLASFIPKEAWEECTSTLNWSFSEGAMKQTTVARQIKSIEEWTDAFMRYAAIYCQAHPLKGVEMWRYGDIIRQAKRKWGGFGWRAYDEQFRALMAVHPRPWSQVDQSLWSMCVTCPQHPAAPLTGPNPHTPQSKKQKGGNNSNNGGANYNSANNGGANKGGAKNNNKGGNPQQGGKQ